MKWFLSRRAEDPVQTARRRLEQTLEADELAFLTAIDRQVRRRNRALRRGQTGRAIEQSETLTALLECYRNWRQDGQVQSLLADMLATPSETGNAAAPSQYLVDSLFLYDCHRFLMQDGLTQRPGGQAGEPEWACAVTGPHLGKIRLLDHLVIVKIAYQSAGGIRLSVDGLQQSLVALQQAGHALHAVFHSHRMKGAEGSRPSRIDLETQEHILEAAYPAIQAIFTEDGYVRFFSWKRPFQIEVYGKGVKHVDGTLFKLQTIDISAAALLGQPVSSR